MRDWEQQERLKAAVFNNEIYYKNLTFMVDAMNRDANSKEARELREMTSLLNVSRRYEEAYPKFEALVTSSWDYKPKLQLHNQLIKANYKFNGSTLYLFPVPVDREYLYYYDVWSNIHYGYVGRCCGFTEAELIGGATYNDFRGSRPISISESIDDNYKIAIGMQMYDLAQSGVTESIVSVTLYSRLDTIGVNTGKFRLQDIAL